MELSDIVLMLDKKYAENPVYCMNEGKAVNVNGRSFSEHGAMTVHKSGANLVCGRCGYSQSADRIED